MKDRVLRNEKRVCAFHVVLAMWRVATYIHVCVCVV